MSGICGIVLSDRNKRLNPGDLSPMVRALNFSGQGEGFSVIPGSAAIGAQRFAGRLAGAAEMALHKRSLALAFHGNLYNLEELFPLKEQDVNPLSELLELYVKEGIAFLQRLRGEFVLALWDGQREILYLATDRFRVHPLFYYQDQEKLVFSSRMKGILACPFPVRRTINLEAIVHVVASSIIPTPKTIFQEVKKVPSGHLLIYEKGEVRTEPYWEVSFLHPSKESESTLAQEFKEHLTEAISISLPPDKTSNHIGTFLSGGVDSSTVTGILTQVLKRPIKAFSIGFGEQRFNEINYARVAARSFESEHYEYFVTPKDTLDAIPILIDAFDEPFANASAVPAYYCAKMAKDHGVNVLYAGDGGDELFAGNERYGIQQFFEYYLKIPTWIRDPILQRLVFTLADRLKWELFVKGKKYIQRACIPYHERISSYDFFNVVPMTAFFEDSILDRVGREFNPYGIFNDYYFEAPAKNNLDRHLYIDWKLTLSDNDLIKVTRMTETAGIAARYPFLDATLVEFSVRVPARIKMRGTKLRTFQKKAYADLLPLEIRRKKKHGFGLPIPVWLRTNKRLNEMMHDLVLSPRSIQRGYFKKASVEKLVEDHKTDETSFSGTILWNLMILELWHRNYFI
jgi:asparagine synthase (glutamine-hydrolysing)